jgi:hypothetical protein
VCVKRVEMSLYESDLTSNHGRRVFIGWWGMKFKVFKIFWSPNSQETTSFFSTNGRIRIQMVEFEFKRTNQEVTPHYCPPAPVAGIVRAVAPGRAPTWVLSL